MNAEEIVAEFRALQDRVQRLEERLSAEEQINARLQRELSDEQQAGDAFWAELLPPAPARRPGVDVSAASHEVRDGRAYRKAAG